MLQVQPSAAAVGQTPPETETAAPAAPAAQSGETAAVAGGTVGVGVGVGGTAEIAAVVAA